MQAIIDIGSNSILLLVATRDAQGKLDIHSDLNRVARLSEGVNHRGTFSDEAIERALVVLREYRAICDELGISLRAVATEGVRMASDQERFLLPASDILRVEVEAISGEQEARLSYLSVAREAGESDSGELRVIDIGGASTELVQGRGEDIEIAKSHAIGSVRLSEMFIQDREGPVSSGQISAIEGAADEAFKSQPLALGPRLHGLAGTVTSCAALLLGLERYDRERVDNTRFSQAQIEELRLSLAKQTNAQRVATTLLVPKRADVIVAGLSILLRAMYHCGAVELVVRDRGLRYAMID